MIEINISKSYEVPAPYSLFRLRWRIDTITRGQYDGPWTPYTDYPSLNLALSEFKDEIKTVYIDGLSLGDLSITTMISCPAYCFKNITYKAEWPLQDPSFKVIGIELEDNEANFYLVLENGTYYHERRE
jgi:hypothetical protein